LKRTNGPTWTKKFKYIGVTYQKSHLKYCAQRRSKHDKKNLFNGCYDDEETAARASDTLARILMENNEKDHKLNFPDDDTEVYPEEKKFKYIGVGYEKNTSKWRAQRWSKIAKKGIFFGYYDDEETAAHASDTLARKLMENGKQKLILNFPGDHTAVQKTYACSSKFIGVTYDKATSKWRAQRWSKNDNKRFSNGYYDDENVAAHASDTLARKLMECGEKKIRLNFPDNRTEENQNKKRQRSRDLK